MDNGFLEENILGEQLNNEWNEENVNNQLYLMHQIKHTVYYE